MAPVFLLGGWLHRLRLVTADLWASGKPSLTLLMNMAVEIKYDWMFVVPLTLTSCRWSHMLQLVVISDPHIKIDYEWPLYNEARNGGHFVKDREGNIYQASCWPGPFLVI